MAQALIFYPFGLVEPVQHVCDAESHNGDQYYDIPEQSNFFLLLNRSHVFLLSLSRQLVISLRQYLAIKVLDKMEEILLCLREGVNILNIPIVEAIEDVEQAGWGKICFLAQKLLLNIGLLWRLSKIA